MDVQLAGPGNAGPAHSSGRKEVCKTKFTKNAAFCIYDKESRSDVAANAYYALFALQHRGQESCGIAVNDSGVISVHKDLGLVRDVFTKEHLTQLGRGQIAGAYPVFHHWRGQPGNAQPLVVRHVKGRWRWPTTAT